ncbi:MAG: DUF3846 domain-containing protein [Christensenellales bacterium]
MKVIIKKPGQLGYEKDIPNTLEALQTEVGGYIEVVHINSRMLAIVNEEGRLLNLPGNDCGLVGTIVYCAEDGEEFTDINAEQAEILLAGYAPVRCVTDPQTGGDVYVR